MSPRHPGGGRSRALDSERFLVGEQGIVLGREGRRAVLLPEVTIEQGWDRAETLTHLSRKAGLAPDAWRSSDTRFWIFPSQAVTTPWRPWGSETTVHPSRWSTATIRARSR